MSSATEKLPPVSVSEEPVVVQPTFAEPHMQQCQRSPDLPPPYSVTDTYNQGYGVALPSSDPSPSALPISPEHPATCTVQLDEETGQNDDHFTKFTEKSIRLGFIRKVFGILFVQLLITCGVVCIFLFVDDVKSYAAKNDWVYIASSLVVIVLLVTISCVESIRRKSPENIILLIIFTVAMSCLLGTFAGAFDTDEILIALGVTVAVTLLMTLLGVQTKFDFTPCIGVASALGMCMFCYVLMCAVFRARFDTLFYSCAGAFLFSLWLLVDIQLLMGGNRAIALDPEEYIFAALQIYIDIVYIFIFLLSLIGAVKN